MCYLKLLVQDLRLNASYSQEKYQDMRKTYGFRRIL